MERDLIKAMSGFVHHDTRKPAVCCYTKRAVERVPERSSDNDGGALWRRYDVMMNIARRASEASFPASINYASSARANRTNQGTASCSISPPCCVAANVSRRERYLCAKCLDTLEGAR